MNDAKKNNYAYEIRFVENNVVQVFDIAAKKKQDKPSDAVLPLEFKEDDVLRGQLRYSKLVGSTSPTTNKDLFGYDDTDQPYRHHIVTNISRNRKSTQRNTFFMMGGGDHKRYDSGAEFIEEDDQDIELYKRNREEEENNHRHSILQRDNKINLVSSSSLNITVPAPITTTASATTIYNEPITSLEPIPTTSTLFNKPIINVERMSTTSNVFNEPITNVERMSTTSNVFNEPITNKERMPTTSTFNEPITNLEHIHNTTVFTESDTNLEHIPTTTNIISIPQQAFIPPDHYDRYTPSQQLSIDTHEASSEKYMQQSMTMDKKSRDCCCIIS